LAGLGATNPTDGIRVEVEGGWYLIRASGTESKIRITAEGETKSVAKRLLESARMLVKGSKILEQWGQR
jgi:phosphoglucosamine mutase